MDNTEGIKVMTAGTAVVKDRAYLGDTYRDR